ncbi:MAG: hypothetical protein Q9220_003231 [cf. Caloplaca sp. 1 TL-2023]
MSSLLPLPTLALIDSTIPYIYLPEDACLTFESALGLVYNKKNNIYFIDDALHQDLSNLNPQFTFSLANDKVSDSLTNITLPYASFDLVMKPPLRPNNTLYFPLRRGADDQITLGRAFLQEAYIITDHEQKNSTVARARFDENIKPGIVSIPWNATAVSPVKTRLADRAIVGVSVGSAIFVLLAKGSFDATLAAEDIKSTESLPIIPIQELDRQSDPELHGLSHQVELLDEQTPSGSGNGLTELPADAEGHNSEVAAARTYNSSGELAAQSSNVSDRLSDMPSNRPVLPRTNPLNDQLLSKENHTQPCRVNKAFPQLPSSTVQAQDHSVDSSPRSSPVSPILEQPQEPLSIHQAQKGPATQKANSILVSSLPLPTVTYAAVFDFEEYKVKTKGRRPKVLDL